MIPRIPSLGAYAALPLKFIRDMLASKTAAQAFDALSPAVTPGDIIWRGATGNERLPIGQLSFVLASSVIGPLWLPIVGGCPSLLNGVIVESHAGNVATLSVKTYVSGGLSDPSVTDPVIALLRDGSGGYDFMILTSPLSITLSQGSTFGVSNNTPFRLWLVLFNDGGTPRLGVINCRGTNSIKGISESDPATSLAEGGAGGADSAQVFYTGTAVAGKFYSIIGQMTWDSGLATAGVWNASPTSKKLFGPGVARPGEALQTLYVENAVQFATSLGTYQTTNLAQAVTPQSPVSAFEVHAVGEALGLDFPVTRLHRGTTPFGNEAGTYPTVLGSLTNLGLDFPGASGSITYSVKLKALSAADAVAYAYAGSVSSMIIKELQG